jgi:hypothetical protein
MKRFRVRKAGQSFAAKGPDLLRVKDNARKVLKGVIARRGTGWYIDKRKPGEKPSWEGPTTNVELLKAFDAWTGAPSEFVIGRTDGDEIEMRYAVRCENVKRLDMDNCSPATITLHSLIHHQFPKVVHSGDYMFRPVSGSKTFWSDHAYGTALDESPRNGMPNDQLFDWEVRMFRSGNAQADYVIGSLSGRVMESAAPDWTIRPSTAGVSHTWHVHTSLVDHDGVKPPREGGVF